MTPEALAALEGFREALPVRGAAPGAVLEQLHHLGSPATTAQGGGRFFGMVNGGALPITLAARLLADSWDQNGAVAAVAPPIAALETVVEGWLQQLFGLPNTVAASFLSGSSLALVTGLALGLAYGVQEALFTLLAAYVPVALPAPGWIPPSSNSPTSPQTAAKPKC